MLTDYSPFAKALQARRTELGVSQRAAAERIGTDRVTYLRWEHGHQHPYTKHWPGIAGFLGIEEAGVQRLLVQSPTARPVRATA